MNQSTGAPRRRAQCPTTGLSPTAFTTQRPPPRKLWSPTRLIATLAGTALTAASLGANVHYAAARAPALSDAILWGSVAACASIGLALSLPALAAAIRQWRLVPAVAALVALAVFGAYSVAGALGNAAGARMSRSAHAAEAGAQRERARSQYEAAEAKLKTLPTTRPVAELTTEITRLEGSRRDLDPSGNGICVGWLPNVKAREVCVAISELKAELGRAHERERVQRALETSIRALDRLGREKSVGNSDSIALSSLLGSAGISITPGLIDELLAALAVVLLEVGGGVLFAISSVFARTARNEPQSSVVVSPLQVAAIEQAAPVATRNQVAIGHTCVPPRPVKLVACNRGATSRLKAWIDSLPLGQPTRISQSEVAGQLGVTRQAIGKQLRLMADRGVIEVAGSNGGTFVTRL